VLQFILNDFDPASPHHGRFEGQLKGNHFTWGITVCGFKRALVIIQWGKYKRDKTKLSWNTGEHNGYDLCQCVKDYMRKIGKPHQSLIEAIASGEVEELMCLQREVGPADGFFSHVQAVAVANTVETLEDTEKRYAEVLLVDRGAVAALQKHVLEDFILKEAPVYRSNGQGNGQVVTAAALMGFYGSDWAGMEQICKECFGSTPVLASITSMKEHTRPRLFVDYFNIRQCIKNDFATDRLVDAIATIGVTLVELGADFRAESALLKRVFCVLELFATVKTKGHLLVCGPALGDAATTKELATVAADRGRCHEVMDSSSSRTRSAEAEAEIKAYIEQSVGFVRTDRVVLSAIVASCVRGVESAFDAMQDRGSSVLLAAGCMLYEVGDYRAAQVQVEGALGKGEAAYGEGAYETAEAVYWLGRCHSRTGAYDMVLYERSLRMNEEEHGKEHAATARSLVGIGSRYRTTSLNDKSGRDVKALECFNLAIARIEAADCPSNHADPHADALQEIGYFHRDKKKWQECLEWSERSVLMRESKHGPDHVLAADALSNIAFAYFSLGEPEKAMTIYLRVLGIFEKARGRLSREAGNTCCDIANIHSTAGRFSEVAGWLKRAVEATGYTDGPTSPKTELFRKGLKDATNRMDPKANCAVRCCFLSCCCVCWVALSTATVRQKYCTHLRVAAYCLPSCCCPCLASSRSRNQAEVQKYRRFLEESEGQVGSRKTMAQAMGYTMGYVLCPVHPNIEEGMSHANRLNTSLLKDGFPSPVGCNVTCDAFSKSLCVGIIRSPLNISIDLCFLGLWLCSCCCCCSEPPCAVRPVSKTFERQWPCLVIAATIDPPAAQQMDRQQLKDTKEPACI
jgi:tetratricopeptide (TPR) repeat protein